ncbi:MAG: hypothetical protein SOI56_09375 [Eubacteriales bacterium]|jgi:cobalamin biosynthesis Mg chelatase CobN
MKKTFVKIVSAVAMSVMLLGMPNMVYAKDLVGYGTTSTVTASTSSGTSSESSSSTVSSAATDSSASTQTSDTSSTGSTSTVSTGTSQKAATTSTTSVSTGVVDDSIPFVLLIVGASVLMCYFIHWSKDQKRYGNYGEYWMEYMIEYENKLK